MSFQNVKNGLISVLDDVSEYEGMVSYADYEILNAGVEKAIVIRFVRMANTRSAYGGSRWRDWTFRLDCFNMIGDDVAQGRKRQDDDRDAIVDALDDNPDLDDVSEVFDAQLTEARQEDVIRAIGDRNFLVERYTVTVREEV